MQAHVDRAVRMVVSPLRKTADAEVAVAQQLDAEAVVVLLLPIFNIIVR